MWPLKHFGALGKLCLCRRVIWLITQADSSQEGSNTCTFATAEHSTGPEVFTVGLIPTIIYLHIFYQTGLVILGVCMSTIHTTLCICIHILIYKYTHIHICNTPNVGIWIPSESESQKAVSGYYACGLSER